MDAYSVLCARLRREPKHWLVTGCAGFIGSNLLETLLMLDQHVTGLDNFSTGHRRNLDQVHAAVGTQRWGHFRLLEADLRSPDECHGACADVDFILHQAALGSVPRSLADPLATNDHNVCGFLNLLTAARDANVRRVVYASSSSVYGDHPTLPKIEPSTGHPLSPYAASKAANELYAAAFAHAYGLQCIGLRYFNVFGPRQDPEGPYAAVIPRWVRALIRDETIRIHGDGSASRDFCYVANAVQANLLAATAPDEAANHVYNIAVGERTTLTQLLDAIRSLLTAHYPHAATPTVEYTVPRPGDIPHSCADVSKAAAMLGYVPTHRLSDGLRTALDWYVDNLDGHE